MKPPYAIGSVPSYVQATCSGGTGRPNMSVETKFSGENGNSVKKKDQGKVVSVLFTSSLLVAENDQPGKVANPARGQLSRINVFFPVPVRA